MKNHPKALLLLIRKRKSYEVNRLKSESKFLSNKRKREEVCSLIETKEDEKAGETEENIFTNLEKIEKELNLHDEKPTNCEGLYNYSKYDQFIDNEMDPYKTNAQNSCLWELYSLRNHYSYKIRVLVSKLEKNFLKSKEFEISSISSIKDEDLLYEDNEKANFYFNSSDNSEDIKKNIGYKIFELI